MHVADSREIFLTHVVVMYPVHITPEGCLSGQYKS
jgi:hypothetical protein